MGTDEGGPQGSLQTQLMLAKIETNEMEIEKLKAENAIIMANLPAFQTGHGIGGQIQLNYFKQCQKFGSVPVTTLPKKMPLYCISIGLRGGGGILYMLGKLGGKTQ